MRFELWLGRAIGDCGFEKWSKSPIRFGGEEEVAEFLYMIASCDSDQSLILSDLRKKMWDRCPNGGIFRLDYGEDKHVAYKVDIIETAPKSLTDAALLVREKISNMSKSELLNRLDKWHKSGQRGEYEELQDFAKFLAGDGAEEAEDEVESRPEEEEPPRYDIFRYTSPEGVKKVSSELVAGDVAAQLSTRTYTAPEVILEDISTGLYTDKEYCSVAKGYYYIRRSN